MAFEIGESDTLRCSVSWGQVNIVVYVSGEGSLPISVSPDDAEKLAEYLSAAALVARHGE